jgi:hypothetical protein
VRIECMTDGRFSGSHFDSFTRTILRPHPKTATSISMRLFGRGSRAAARAHGELPLVRSGPFDHFYNCNGSDFLCAPVQSLRRNKKEKDNHYS